MDPEVLDLSTKRPQTDTDRARSPTGSRVFQNGEDSRGGSWRKEMLSAPKSSDRFGGAYDSGLAHRLEVDTKPSRDSHEDAFMSNNQVKPAMIPTHLQNTPILNPYADLYAQALHTYAAAAACGSFARLVNPALPSAVGGPSVTFPVPRGRGFIRTPPTATAVREETAENKRNPSPPSDSCSLESYLGNTDNSKTVFTNQQGNDRSARHHQSLLAMATYHSSSVAEPEKRTSSTKRILSRDKDKVNDFEDDTFSTTSENELGDYNLVKRRKNNEAARKSREARKAKGDMTALKMTKLQQENVNLHAELKHLKQETRNLHNILYNPS